MEPFRVRLNCVDHYQALPTRFDPQFQLPRLDVSHEKSSSRVPVIRVFGATQSGQKVCAHIHGAFPYLYVEYEGSLASNEAEAYIQRFQLSIDHALAISYRKNLSEDKSSFVALITLVKGTPFYGYFEGYKFYLKIYLFNPLHITRLSDLLRQGIVMKKVLQPYESHLQYILQWMCDYNLYGCGYIDCQKVTFRSPVPKFEDTDGTLNSWHDQSIPPHMIVDETEVSRQSHCSIEVDICVQDILNRKEIEPRLLHHDFVERLHSHPPDEKLLPSMAGLWKDETRRRKSRMVDADPGSSPFPADVLISMSAEPRSSQRGGWIHEREYMDKVRAIITEENARSEGRTITFDSFFQTVPFTDTVKSTFESVQDLHPENLRALLEATRGAVTDDSKEVKAESSKADVDESRLSNLGELNLLDELDNGNLPEGGKAANARDGLGNPCAGEGARAPQSQDGTRNASDRLKSHERSMDNLSNGSPVSSTDLAKYGIHHIQHFVQTQDDKFDIPLDYTSGLSVARLSSKRSASVSEAERRPVKRPKIQQDDKETPNSHIKADGGTMLSKNRAPAELLSTVDSSYVRPGLLSNELDPKKKEFSSQRSHGSSTRTSQETIKASSISQKSLGFAVVKDPNDPNTIKRLSQHSASSQKNPNHSTPKHVSFDSWKSGAESSTVILKSSSASFGENNSEASDMAVVVAHDIASSFGQTGGTRWILCYKQAPPTALFVSSTMSSHGLMPVLYQDAYYSKESDVPARTREYAGRGFRLGSITVPFLPEFNSMGQLGMHSGESMRVPIRTDKLSSKRRQACRLKSWEIGQTPPSRAEVEDWLLERLERREHGEEAPNCMRQAQHELPASNLSQIDGPTQKNRYGFKFSQKRKSSSIQKESRYMSVMSLEVHVNTRADLLPNPEEDEISCVFWCCQGNDDLGYRKSEESADIGVLVLSNDGLARNISREVAVETEEQPTELDLINRIVDIVRTYDPDILTGYEVHGGSWGYLIERAQCKYEFNLCNELSRVIMHSRGRFGKENDRWGFNQTSTISVTGRHMINIWRAIRGELNLLQYSLENVAFHLLHRRLPHYSHKDLTTWFKSGNSRDSGKVLDYYLTRVQTDLDILEKNELIPRTSEQARILGVDFFSVFSRGSQFKVESLMFRIAKTEGYMLISPSRKQVGQQNALECLPLIMEPQSDFYNSPLLVLDFQALYPSIMIAYNYCYSTFLGRIVSWRGQNKMGFTDYQREPQILELLKDHINIAPNGMMYVKPEIRKSLLAKMLSEILETRVMVKSGMKIDKDDKALQQLLNNRQLALKLIANVTYGYTSASFSGRMPCSEIADSIVQTARETLEKTIALIHSVERWGAEVVYGDTDSLFVYLKGRSKDEAFDIGNEIVQTVTNRNPRPVKLKFEKVYLPSVLLAKKRYVGFKYEHKSQEIPVFDAKGIETVRRDGTPAEQKIEETALKILFRTADLSQVKDYFQRQCTKIMQGKVSIQDFCFAREVRLGTYSDKGPPPPGALISARKMLRDPRSEPQYGERVPYVVIAGAPGARLIDRCVAPEFLLHNEHAELDAEYYITKNIIPPLERIFNLVGANVRSWYDEMPKFQRIRRIEGSDVGDTKDLVSAKKTLESYMKSSLCLVCREKVESNVPICDACLARDDASFLTAQRRINKAERRAVNLETICRSCSALPWGEKVKCDSKDCPVFYSRTRQMVMLRNTKTTMEAVQKYLEGVRSDILDW